MAEYIEQNESICRRCFHSYVCEQFNEHRNSDNQNCHFFNDHFVPAADVVEVVRCWKCEYHLREQDPCHGRTEHYCKKLKTQVHKDFFCGYGARMDGDKDAH